MSLRVLFGGTTLIKPGAASRVVSNSKVARLTGSGILAVIGEATAGAPKEVVEFNNPAAMRAYFRSGPLADAASICFAPSNDPRINGSPEKVVCYKVNNSTQSTLVIKNATAASLITLTSKGYGEHMNKLSAKLASDVLTLEFSDFGRTVKEESPPLGRTAKFSVVYSGTGTAATVAIDGTKFASTVTSGEATDTLNIPFSECSTIEELVARIDAHPNYTATLIAKSQPSFACALLDQVTAVSVKKAQPTDPDPSFSAVTQDYIDWINANSSLVTAARTSPTATGTPQAFAKTFFTGGTLGSSSDADWQDAFDELGRHRVHECVPLVSKDGDEGGINKTADSYTISSVAAAASAYEKSQSSIAGMNEVQVYFGLDGTKSEVTELAQTLNSEGVCLTFQQMNLLNAQGKLEYLPAWSSALTVAALRASASIGEPLTYKYVRCFGTKYDSSIVLPDDINNLLLAGVMVIENVPGKGYRIVKGCTTYTKADDDVYTEESVVMTWKNLMYGWRSMIEDYFVGLRGNPGTLNGVRSISEAYFSKAERAGMITDSEDEAGNPLNAWRNIELTVSGDVLEAQVETSIAQGINFALLTNYVVPVKLSA